MEQATGESGALIGAATRHLAHSGQVIYDLSADLYRCQQIMPQAVGESEIGPPHEELVGLQKILEHRRIEIESSVEMPTGGRVVMAKVDGSHAIF